MLIKIRFPNHRHGYDFLFYNLYANGGDLTLRLNPGHFKRIAQPDWFTLLAIRSNEGTKSRERTH